VAFLWLAWENRFPVPYLIASGYEYQHRKAIVRPGDWLASTSQGKLHTTTYSSVEDGETLSIYLKLRETESVFPAMAVWAETQSGTLIETFFLSDTVAYSDQPLWNGKQTQRSKILPIWRHRYTAVSGIDADGKVDVISGATEKHQFSLKAHISEKHEPFYLFLEVNKPGDANEEWSDKHVGQPSVLYSVLIEPESTKEHYLMELTGHGGKGLESGLIHYDLNLVGSAKQIVDLVLVSRQRLNNGQ